MAYPLPLKRKAEHLRKNGYSLKEIAKKLCIAKGTASKWLRDIALSEKALKRLQGRRRLGQYKAQQTRKKNREKKFRQLKAEKRKDLSGSKIDERILKLCCSLLFWCEGGKYTDSHIAFVNSDPILIQTFVNLLRQSFKLDEKKFRALIHIHEYHSDTKQKKFWSKITKIPIGQFTQSYKKPNTKKRKRKSYPGCVRVSYHDAKVAKELKALYTVFGEKFS